MASAQRATITWLIANQSARAAASTPAELQDEMPFIRVSSVGGSQNMTVASSRIAVEFFAGSLDAADAFAQTVHNLLLWRFRGVIGDTTVTGVDVEQLPTPVPYPNQNVFMSTARYVVFNRDLAAHA
jgi:hypothetical protein